MGEDRPDQDIESLDARLKKARGEPDAPGAGAGGQLPGRALGLAFRVGVELVSALAIGVAVGWGLDAWLGTGPWLLLAFILLGGAAGILNVYRLARGFGYAVGYRQDQKDRNGNSGDQGPGIEG